jgi:hypothetical protein
VTWFNNPEGAGYWRFRIVDPKNIKKRTLIYVVHPQGNDQAARDAARINAERYGIKFTAVYEQQETKNIEQAKKETEEYMQTLQNAITDDQS